MSKILKFAAIAFVLWLGYEWIVSSSGSAGAILPALSSSPIPPTMSAGSGGLSALGEGSAAPPSTPFLTIVGYRAPAYVGDPTAGPIYGFARLSRASHPALSA